MTNCFRPTLWTACIAMLAAMDGTVNSAAETAAGNATRRWTLKTADTKLTLGIGDDQSFRIHELSGPDGWNWTATASLIPLLGRIDVAGNRVAPNWSLP